MIDIGSRRECFFDDFLIDSEKTTAEKRLNKPERKGVILEFDKPWEGNMVTFPSIFFADGLWRMYYVSNQGKERYICYAESSDAITWERPSLGLVEFGGSRDNNIILDKEALKAFEFTGFDNMSVFYDESPTCPPDEKYKMVAWWIGHAALVLLTSSDGIHFPNFRFITDDGEFDSQNRAFWSDAHGKYFCYFRGEHEPDASVHLMDKSYTDKTANALYDPMRFLLREPGAGTFTFMRDVRVMESENFKDWSKQRRIAYNGADCQMYNNCVFPYPRAPHILIAFTLRYVERKSWTKNYEELCGSEDRVSRMKSMARLGLAITDGLFMSSRDGYSFTKFDESFLPPPPENPEAFVYGDGTAAPAVIEVPSDIPGADNEYMIIQREAYRTAKGCSKLVKYAIRLDGFVSLHAGGEERVLTTKPFVYDGTELYANIATSARGSACFTLSAEGEKYTSLEIFGNSCDKRIRFDNDEAVRRLSGKEVAMTVRMYDCDLYSIRFEKDA